MENEILLWNGTSLGIYDKIACLVVLVLFGLCLMFLLLASCGFPLALYIIFIHDGIL